MAEMQPINFYDGAAKLGPPLAMRPRGIGALVQFSTFDSTAVMTCDVCGSAVEMDALSRHVEWHELLAAALGR